MVRMAAAAPGSSSPLEPAWEGWGPWSQAVWAKGQLCFPLFSVTLRQFPGLSAPLVWPCEQAAGENGAPFL